MSRGLVAALVAFATFTDILAYSIAVPVLPHLSQQFGASPTLIGLLFGSFGVTVLAVSVPMGSVSDRIGRRLPLVGGLIVLAAASVLFAFAPSMPWLFAARLVQGAADAVTWVVGFALIADLYTARERGRVMGLVMSGSTFGFMVGPTLGGWLYERGGARMPYLAVAALAIVAAAGFAALHLPRGSRTHEAVPLRAILKVRAVTVCALAVAVGGGTLAMIEPILSLFLAAEIKLGPARIGLVFGAGAVVATVLHPVFGRVADRTGGRQPGPPPSSVEVERPRPRGACPHRAAGTRLSGTSPRGAQPRGKTDLRCLVRQAVRSRPSAARSRLEPSRPPPCGPDSPC